MRGNDGHGHLEISHTGPGYGSAMDKKAVCGAVTRIWFCSLGLPDKGLNLPGDSRHLDAGRREDGVRRSRCVRRVKLMREGI